MCQASSGDNSKKGKVFLEMLNNCLDQIRAPSSEHRVFMRCDVNFDTTLQGRNLNTIIGRAAHIEFLESDTFAKFIMWSFPELFTWLFARGHLFHHNWTPYRGACLQCWANLHFCAARRTLWLCNSTNIAAVVSHLLQADFGEVAQPRCDITLWSSYNDWSTIHLIANAGEGNN